MTYNNLFGLLNIVQTIGKELNGNSFTIGKWYDGVKDSEAEQTFFNFTGLSSLDRVVVDNYLKTKLGKCETYADFDITGKTDEEVKEIYNDIACMFKAREQQLNRQYYSVILEYNPLVNYDKDETQTHNDSNTIGARQTTLNSGARSESNSYGARSESNTKGARTDSTIDNNSVSPFDSTAYNKPTTKSESTFTSGAETDGHTAQAYTDGHTAQAVTDTQSTQQATDSNSGGYHLKTVGNIGTMTSSYMLNELRRDALFNFVDELVKLIENDLVKMVYDL